MNTEAESKFISVDPNVRGGVPHIVGTRLTVADILWALAADPATANVVQREYPQLHNWEILTALEWAAADLEYIYDQSQETADGE